MRKLQMTIMAILLLSSPALTQNKSQNRLDDQAIRISTELVQWDVVVTDRQGHVVTGLTRDDFEIYEAGRKQHIGFFEFVGTARKLLSRAEKAAGRDHPPVSPQGPVESEVRRILAFVVDDLTIRNEDLYYVRQMLTDFIEKRMEPTDIVAIVRTVGGKGLLQQFTTSKEMLARAIASLKPVSHRFNVFNDPAYDPSAGRALPLNEVVSDVAGDLGESADTSEADTITGDTNRMMRAFMCLGTASFIIDSMRELPGRKSLVLISGGLPILDLQASTASGNVSHFINQLTDKATRAGVAIHTMDVLGLSSQVGVARFVDTPGKSMLSMDLEGLRSGRGNATLGFGRTIDEAMLGNPHVMQDHLGLRALAANTGGIAVLNRNNFDAGLAKIVDASEGYYLLAYTPYDSDFKGGFRKVEVKVKHDGLKVYSRRGYIAREEKAADSPASKRDRLLEAIKSPLAHREIDMDVMLLYKAVQPAKGAIDIHLVIAPKKLQFEQAGGKHAVSFDVAGFVFDELGRLRGGFGETVTTNLTQEEYMRVSKGGFTYSASTSLPAGAYQIRLAVRDARTGSLGTMSRYIEVPDLSNNRLTASSLLLGAVPANDTKATRPAALGADRQISRKDDLRYAMMIYNAKLKDGRPQLRSQLLVSQNGRVIFKEGEEAVPATGKNMAQVIKVGQLGLSRVKPGRYTLSLVITDSLADKKSQTVVRNMDFIVIE